VIAFGEALRRDGPPELALCAEYLAGVGLNADADVFVDLDAELAIVVVDGVVFRAHNQQVVILRSCAECGITRFESAPLAAAPISAMR
jgi:hypothetical protein